MIYGVSRKAIGYPYVIPPEAEGNALLVTTYQISLAGQVFHILTCKLEDEGLTKTDRSNGPFTCFSPLPWDARK